MPTTVKACKEPAAATRSGMPPVYYRLYDLLHTLRSLECHQDQICAILSEIQRSGKAGAAVRRELTGLLEQLPTIDSEVQAVWSSLE